MLKIFRKNKPTMVPVEPLDEVLVVEVPEPTWEPVPGYEDMQVLTEEIVRVRVRKGSPGAWTYGTYTSLASVLQGPGESLEKLSRDGVQTFLETLTEKQ